MKSPLILILGLTTQLALGQQMYFPPLAGSTWGSVTPQELGWCTEFIPPLFNYLGQ